MKHLLNFIKKALTILQHFFKYLAYKPKTIQKKKHVYFNLSNPRIYNRYAYALAKFFLLEDYDIIFPKTFKQFRYLHQKETYLGLVSKEEGVFFRNRMKHDACFEINDNNLSGDYFSFLIEKNSDGYYIPIAQHPLMYADNLWNLEVKISKKKNSVFMIGNFNEEGYKRIENTSLNVISRPQIYNHLKQTKTLTAINTKAQLDQFIDSTQDHKCILVKRQDFSIAMKNIRPTLASFNFFMACPGFIMPYAHNIVEAMSVGAIPIIQDVYAELFFPALQNTINAIIFTSLSDLSEKIELAYNLDSNTLEQMQAHVTNYYNTYLTPKAVINAIEKNKNNTIFLLAEEHSVSLFEAQKKHLQH